MRLAKQGILIVGMILVVEVCFLGFLSWMLHTANIAIGRYEYGMEVVTRTQGLLKIFVDGAQTLATYAVTRNEKQGKEYDDAVKDVEPSLAALKKLVKDDPETLRKVNKLSKLAREASAQFSEAKNELDEGEFVNFTRLRKQLMPILHKIMGEAQPFIVAQEKLAKSFNPVKARQTRDQVSFLLWGIGVPLNIVLAVVAMGWFTSRITGRLAILSDNTKRLESGEDLKPPMEGGDEISSLDQVFHSMANALRESAEKERVATEFIKFSEHSLRTITDNVPVALITVDENGTIESVNPTGSAMFEYRTDEFWKKNVSELFDVPANSNSESFVRDFVAKTETRPAELDARTKSGGIVPIELSIREFDTKNGKRYLATILDITERHEMERLKREFVAMVSHDLRTPLMTVQASLSLLAEGVLGELPPEATKIASKAEVQVERLRDLVSNLLDLARIESGRFDVTIGEILLQDVFENSADSVAGLAAEYGVKVEVTHNEFEIAGDADRLIQVTANLLSNAIKFSDSGASVILSAVERDKEWIEVRIQDFGRGIPEDQQQKIFSRFEQVEDDDSRKHKGIGLGLSICQAIIEGHDGEIGVESEVGKGSTFWYRVRQVVDS
jgi:PAS domain S-box-containing protein